jgi:plasmid replication initiation protein
MEDVIVIEDFKDASKELNYHVPNYLVRAEVAYHKMDLLLIYYIAANVKDDEESFDKFYLHINMFKQVLGRENSNSVYEQVKDSIKRIQKSSFEFKVGTTTSITSIIAHADIEENSGQVIITLDSKIKPYFYDLKQKVGYTRGKYGILPDISRASSIRIYMYLKGWQNVKREVTMSLPALNDFLFTKDKYKRFYDFEKNVLKPIVEDINGLKKNGERKTDMIISYEKIKKGRSIAAIKFIFEVDPYNVTDNPVYKKTVGQSHWVDQVRGKVEFIEALSDAQVYELYMIANEVTSNSHIDVLSYMFKNHYYVIKNQDKIKTNYYSYLKAALQGNYVNA